MIVQWSCRGDAEQPWGGTAECCIRIAGGDRECDDWKWREKVSSFW